MKLDHSFVYFDSSFVVTNLREMDNGVIAEQGLSLLIPTMQAYGARNASRQEIRLEEVVGVNHFGHFLVTNLLLEDLKRADSEVVVLGSKPPISMRRRRKVQEDQTLLPSRFQKAFFPKEENYVV
jgi:NAD(P)-dependent dehydrogenase (short-subunit alcohol dehydrogenase family)